MDSLLNIDLISVGIAIAANIILGFVVFYRDRKNTTGRLFLLQTIILSFWSVANYFSYKVTDLVITLWIQRLVLFSAVPNSIVFLFLMHTFPKPRLQMPKRIVWLISFLAVATMLLTLTPFVFSGTVLIPGVVAPQPTVAPGMIIFALVAVLSIPLGIFFLIKKYIQASVGEKNQFRFLLAGVIIMFALIVTFNFIFPTFLQNTRFIPFSAVFTFPFVALTSYAIYRHHLFNIKVAAIAFVAFILTVFSFINILYASSASQIAVNITLFVAVLIGSVILIKSVLKEIEQRERIQSLADDLSKANENQVALIHFITHQVKGFFTKSRNIFSLLTEGEAGPLTPEMQKFVAEGFDSDTKGVAMVQDVLNAANIRSGIVKYDIEPFDISTLVGALVIEYKKMAEDKGLQLIYSCWGKPEHAAATGCGTDTNTQVPNCAIDMKTHANYIVSGDEEQLRQVFKNLIENAIRYTLKGSITVRLSQSVADSAADHTVSPKVVFSVRDTGVGLTDEDKALLFTQGGRGKDSLKVNVESTGYGLFIAKGIVTAHHGRIWAESEGRDKGSTFYVELPGI